MSKKKLTNKEITDAINIINKNTQYLNNKLLQIDNLFGLYLEYSKNTDEFNNFVKAKAEKFEKKQRKLKQKEKIMDIVELVMQVLKSENWGVYYKNQPMQPLEMQDGNSLYKVNQVDEVEIETAIEKALTKENPWESSQTNSNQNENSTNG